MKNLVVGLGNYGEQYKNTRHNVGFIVLDSILGKEEWSSCTTCKTFYKEVGDVLYMKPKTMMNLSGTALKCRADRHLIAPENIIVMHDEVDLEFGKFRISYDSSAGGNNGIKSIIDSLGTKKFVRIRVGIAPTTLFGKKKKPSSVERFVLGNFPNKKIKKLEDLSITLKEVIGTIILEGREVAMNKFN